MNESSLTVFGRRGDPSALAVALSRQLSGSQVTRTGGDYRIDVGPKGSLFRKPKPDLIVQIETERFKGKQGSAERGRVRSELLRSVRGPGLDGVLGMIPHLQIAVSFTPEDGDGPLRPTDRVFRVALDVAARTDGFMLDHATGRLVSSTGQFDFSGDSTEDDLPADPSIARVKGRMVALVGVAARALTEYDGLDVHEAREGIVVWVRSVGLDAELEEEEEAILLSPPGSLDEETLATCTWRIEGAAVLAWSLRLIDKLPSHDQAVDPTRISAVLRFPEASATQAVLRSVTQRLLPAVWHEQERHDAILWRLSGYLQNGEALALGPHVTTADGVRLRFDEGILVDGDLGIGGRPIAEADPEDVHQALRLTEERLTALHWLRAGGRYSAILL